jgi:cephalosporin hydroxylase
MNLVELGERLKPLGDRIWLKYPEEWECLLKYAGLSRGPIVEVGTAFGGSACILVFGSDKQVYSIDPYKEPSFGGWVISATYVNESMERVQGDWELYHKRWAQWVDTSSNAAEYYKKWMFTSTRPDMGPLGLVFIDGNHDYEYVKQDVELWIGMIQPGGYLILHDSANRDLTPPGGCQYQGPHQVAAELREDKRVKWLETAYSMTVWEVV